jgi:DMSO/TMAO reductase YedYZ heme-binding membrane subunit
MTLHKVTGRIILGFFALHVVFYVGFLVQMDLWSTFARQPKIAVGLASAVIFLLMGVTSMQWVRRRWYAVFYNVHVAGSVGVLGLLWFHVEAIRLYLVESAVVVVVRAVVRLRRARKGE